MLRLALHPIPTRPGVYEAMNYQIDVCVQQGIDAVRRLFG